MGGRKAEEMGWWTDGRKKGRKGRRDVGKKNYLDSWTQRDMSSMVCYKNGNKGFPPVEMHPFLI